MRKIMKHSTSLIILTIATGSILDFSFRKAPVPIEFKKVNLTKVKVESPEQNREAFGSEHINNQDPSVENMSFLLDGFFYNGGLFPMDMTLKRENSVMADLDPEAMIPFYGFKEHQFSHFLSLVKIEENRTFQEIVLSKQKQ